MSADTLAARIRELTTKAGKFLTSEHRRKYDHGKECLACSGIAVPVPTEEDMAAFALSELSAAEKAVVQSITGSDGKYFCPWDRGCSDPSHPQCDNTIDGIKFAMKLSQAARKEEREECAQIAERMNAIGADRIGDAIRNRE